MVICRKSHKISRCSPIGLIPSMKIYKLLRSLTKKACGRRLFCTTSALTSQEVAQDLIPERRWNNLMVPTPVSDMLHLNTQLKQLVKTGYLDDARKFFFNMPQRDVISWTTIISGYVSTSDYHEALNLISSMWFEPSSRMDPFILSVALKACGLGNYANYGDLLHCVAVKTGLDDNVFVGSALLDMYTKTGRISEGCIVFDEMPERNVVSWTAIIAGLVNTGHSQAGLVYFAEMGRCNVHFDSYTFATALKACAALSDIDHGREVHTQTIKKGFDEISFVANTLATMYSKCGKLDYALTLFRRMKTPDVVSWTTVIATYVQIGKEAIANQEFMRMIELNIRPNEYTFAAIISGCSDLKWGEQLHNQVTKAGLMDSLSVSNSVMTMYSKFGLLCSTSMVFDAMSRRDIISWSTIISGYCQGGLAEEAFQLLSRMRREGPKPTEFAFASVLSVCGQMAILEQGRQLHAHVLTLGLEQTSMIQSAVINMYAKCGSIQEASEIFKVTRNSDIISWTAMINGYAEHGHVQEAIDVFERIPQAGLKPDSVTFIGILTACSHAGLVDLGYHYFNSMGNKYHIDPSKEHYGCMIDLLCRAGRLNEAENMINSMPCKQDDVVWSTLLRACRIHGDIERGRRAAEKILELNPNCAGTHITLANVYSVRGKWREAAEVRRAMKAKGVIKEPGSSWIKVKDRVSAFVSGDRTHPEGQTIYGILELLAYGADMASQDTESILCGEQD